MEEGEGLRVAPEHAPDDSPEWTPPKSPAIQRHAEYLPPIDEFEALVPSSLRCFPHPDRERGITQAHQHQVDGAVRALAAFSERDGFLLQDDAGLGKTVTACLTLAAQIMRDGLGRRLIVVPPANKESLFNQWRDDGAMLGLNIKRGMPADGNERGVWLVSYDELQTKIVTESGSRINSGELDAPLAAGFDTVCFDEAHNMKNCSPISAAGAKVSQNAQAAVELAAKSSKVLYMSATPFTDVKDTRYLDKLGLFNGSDSDFAHFAEFAGATVHRDHKGAVKQVINPPSTMPMAAVAAKLHAEGLGIKRITDMTGLATRIQTSDWNAVRDGHRQDPEHTVSPKEMQDTFVAADEIFQAALDHEVLPGSMAAAWKSQWSKAYWESCKIGQALGIAEETLSKNPNAHVAFFSSYKDAAKHAHLHALIAKARSSAEKAFLKDNDARGRKLQKFGEWASAKLGELPTPKNPVEEIASYFSKKFGEDAVAHVYGNDTKGRTAKGEQQAYQRGDKRILIATMAKGGTGLSFHDTDGGRPRTQINMSLPWSATNFVQVAGRSHRLGSKSNTEMHWLSGDDAAEQKAAAIVAQRARTMGSLTSGDPAMIRISDADMARFENSDQTEEAEADSTDAEHVAATQAQEDEDTRGFFEESLRKYARGGDALKDLADERRSKRATEVERDVRRFSANLRFPLGIGIHPSGGGMYVIHSTRNPPKQRDRARKEKALDFLKANGATTDHRGWIHVDGETVVRMAQHIKSFDKKATPDDASVAFVAPGHTGALKQAFPSAPFEQLAELHDLHNATLMNPGLVDGKVRLHPTAGMSGWHESSTRHEAVRRALGANAYEARSATPEEHKRRLEAIREQQGNYDAEQAGRARAMGYSSPAPAMAAPESVRTRHGLIITKNASGGAYVTGKTFDNKTAISRAGGRWRPPNGWVFESYDDAVAKLHKGGIARALMTLAKALAPARRPSSPKGSTWVPLAPSFGASLWGAALAKGGQSEGGVMSLPLSLHRLFRPDALMKHKGATGGTYVKKVPTGKFRTKLGITPARPAARRGSGGPAPPPRSGAQ